MSGIKSIINAPIIEKPTFKKISSRIKRELWLKVIVRKKTHTNKIKQAKRVLKRLSADEFKQSGSKTFSYLRKIDPLVFEECLLFCFERRGFKVKRNKTYTGDGGLDGKVTLDDGSHWAIQAKRYSNHINPKHVKEFSDLVSKGNYTGGFFIHTGKTGERSHQNLAEDIYFISGGNLHQFITQSYSATNSNKVLPTIRKKLKHPSWLWFTPIAGVLLVNEFLAYAGSIILNITYFPFPESFKLNYLILMNGGGWALALPFIFLIACISGTFLTIQGHKIGQALLALPIALVLGSFLGNLIYSFLNNATFALSPFHVFSLISNYGYGVHDSWILPTYGVGLFLGIVVIFGTLIKKVWHFDDKVHGDSRWATLFDLLTWKMLKKGEEGLLLGKYAGFRVYSKGFEHVLVLAPAGGGKSTSFAIPNIMLWNGSTINNDMAFELYEKTSVYCRDIKKSKVFLFAPTRKETMRWNIFDNAINMPPETRYGEIQRICLFIIPQGKGKDSEWAMFARRVVEGIVAYCISTTKHCTLGDLAEICCRPDFNNWLRKEVIENGDADAQFKVNANAFLGLEAPETKTGVKFNLDAYFGLYLDPLVRAATSTSDFNLADLRREKMDIFIGIPDGQLERLAPLITMFWEDASSKMTNNVPKEDEPYPVFFNIDEAGNLNRLNTIRRNLNILRKFRVRCAIYFQFKDQAGDHYTKDELKSFFNCKTKLVYTQSDTDDAEYVSKEFGQRTVKSNTKSRKAWSMEGNDNEQLLAKPLITADHIKRLSEKIALVSINGRYGIKVHKNYYYKDREMKHYIQYEVDSKNDVWIPAQTPIFPVVLGGNKEHEEIINMNNEALERRLASKQFMQAEKQAEFMSNAINKNFENTIMPLIDEIKEIKQNHNETEKQTPKDQEDKEIIKQSLKNDEDV